MCNVMIFNSFVKDMKTIFATVLHFKGEVCGGRGVNMSKVALCLNFFRSILWRIDFENSKVN